VFCHAVLETLPEGTSNFLAFRVVGELERPVVISYVRVVRQSLRSRGELLLVTEEEQGLFGSMDKFDIRIFASETPARTSNLHP
jgi:hypothetical protein